MCLVLMSAYIGSGTETLVMGSSCDYVALQHLIDKCLFRILFSMWNLFEMARQGFDSVSDFADSVGRSGRLL